MSKYSSNDSNIESSSFSSSQSSSLSSSSNKDKKKKNKDKKSSKNKNKTHIKDKKSSKNKNKVQSSSKKQQGQEIYIKNTSDQIPKITKFYSQKIFLDRNQRIAVIKHMQKILKEEKRGQKLTLYKSAVYELNKGRCPFYLVVQDGDFSHKYKILNSKDAEYFSSEKRAKNQSQDIAIDSKRDNIKVVADKYRITKMKDSSKKKSQSKKSKNSDDDDDSDNETLSVDEDQNSSSKSENSSTESEYTEDQEDINENEEEEDSSYSDQL